ncbi:CCHC-type domain-containing protein [Nephila pilipes]|uniref:CCHC-type domain-containing protein n=1 Tax=Nephila pilipes TaxID=299642 RepID=A0A8X6IN23_NEPPI|nr:CCHC-type domain-containing protein [Nephila pilipes]
MKQKRIGLPKFQWLPNIEPVAAIKEELDLASNIFRIIKEKVLRFFNQTDEPLDLHFQYLKEIIQHKVERVLASIAEKPSETRSKPTYVTVIRNSSVPMTRPPKQPRKTYLWRTVDNRPICFHCGRPGYVVRYCRER